jgi:Tripartite ATP-independent periplasmic transporter, DctM component
MLLRVPVGIAMGLVGVAGFGYLSGSGPALKIVGHTSMRTVTDWNFAVVPLFLLMGSFATTSGMSRELFRAANAFLSATCAEASASPRSRPAVASPQFAAHRWPRPLHFPVSPFRKCAASASPRALPPVSSPPEAPSAS